MAEDADQKQADDEMAERRRIKAEKDAADEAAATGKSIEDLENDGDLEPEDDGQFAFEVPATRGKELKWGDLVPKGVPVEHRVAMTGKSIHNPKGGLLDPNDVNGLLLVSYVLDHYKPQYIRDENGAITKVVMYAVIKPKHVVNARTEAGETLLHGEAAA